MATNPEHDTDPSTPGAKRLSDPRTKAAAAASHEYDTPAPPRARRVPPTTDPGLAPPPRPLPVPDEPMGIVVPSAGPKAGDSVDLLLDLLDGIGREQSAPHRGSPRKEEAPSFGSHHAGHAIPAAQSPVLDEPKVVIDKAHPVPTVRISRVPRPPPDGSRELPSAMARSLARRLVVAIGAGLVIAISILVALQQTSKERPPGTARPPVSPTTPASAVSPSAAAPPAPKEVPAAIPLVVPESLPLAPSAASTSASTTVAKVPPSVAPAKQQAKPPASATRPDLGEFKLSF